MSNTLSNYFDSFSIMIIKYISTEIQLDDGTIIKPNTQVKLMSAKLDSRFTSGVAVSVKIIDINSQSHNRIINVDPALLYADYITHSECDASESDIY